MLAALRVHEDTWIKSYHQETRAKRSILNGPELNENARFKQTKSEEFSENALALLPHTRLYPNGNYLIVPFQHLMVFSAIGLQVRGAFIYTS